MPFKDDSPFIDDRIYGADVRCRNTVVPLSAFPQENCSFIDSTGYPFCNLNRGRADS